MNTSKFNLPGINELKTNECKKYEGGLFFIVGTMVAGITATLVIKALDWYDSIYCKSHPEQCTSHVTEHHPGGIYVPVKG